MKKKRFNDGGYTDQEASDLMKNDVVPKRSTYLTSNEPATPQSAEDTAAENAALAREAAQEARRSAPRAAAPVVTPSRNDYSMNEMEGSGRGSEPAPRARVGATPRPVPAQNPTLPNVTPRVRNIPSSPEASPGLTARPSESMRLRREKEKLRRERPLEHMPMKKGGAVKASKRGDGIAQRGKTKGRMI